jgi:hypothetical protein
VHGGTIVLGNLISLLMGTMLGLLIRSSPGALVVYFVYSLLVPNLFGLLASSQAWFHDRQPWVDLGFAQTALFDGTMTATRWAHIASTVAIWLVLPAVLGLRRVMRAEVK